MSYLRAGIFAEGPTDYAFLRPLLDRLLPDLAPAAMSRVPVIGDSIGIDAPGRPPARRGERIASAIDAFWDECTLFVIHGDGEGDPDRARRERIDPGMAATRARHPDAAIAACVPVREIEAWLLADQDPFAQLLAPSLIPVLPADPEAVSDPKLALEHLVTRGGLKLRREVYELFGANVSLSGLRRLPAFRRFEEELTYAIRFAAGER